MRNSQSEPLDDLLGYGLAVGVTALATGMNALMAARVAPTNLVMVYLLGVTYVATRCSPRPAILASLLSVAAFDFFFVHPSGTFAVADVQYVLVFGVMLIVSLLISTLTFRLREQSKARGDAALHAQIEETRSDLLSAVSHDLRTPLASIEGSAGALLQQPELTEQSVQLATTIQDESVRMARLIRNLLDMTRMHGRIELELDWYGLDELVANAILRTESMFERPVRLDVAPAAPLAWVDGVLMEQVFVNLLENASRHAGRAAQVDVRINSVAGKLVVEVIDDGPGIGDQSVNGIFERFQGAKKGGFGLGLAICRAAVEAHEGKIWAENAPGRGAKFAIELPLRKEAGN
jgi:K+-sensing histidine kinase KdpD